MPAVRPVTRNEDSRIGASDVTCIARLLQRAGNLPCRHKRGHLAAPQLSIPQQLPAQPGGKVTVPIVLQTNDSNTSSLLFSVDYDEQWLHFDSSDNNQDGIPDAITFDLPQPLLRAVTVAPQDTSGELAFTLADFASTSHCSTGWSAPFYHF